MCLWHAAFGRGQEVICFLLATLVRSEVLREFAHVFIPCVEVEHNWIVWIKYLAQQRKMWSIANCKLRPQNVFPMQGQGLFEGDAAFRNIKETQSFVRNRIRIASGDGRGNPALGR